ncbi:hypothetical protein [Caballeronia sp. LZ019]|uniref:hypothetical protein n=1 Tax=Caballeronia sp. LZ019 TaxID=3038555 RepID=UPI002854736A|nr:hypothetical protein [Caballeronia sp. LZ019]MDR5809820.1 hypothetical protein [Caballeronia sp. LZ019]
MKMTLFALLATLFATAAHAEIMMYMNNEAGGLLQFSDMPCSNLTELPKLQQMKGFIAISLGANGKAELVACYEYTEPTYHTVWSNGEARWYRQDALTLTAAGKRVLKAYNDSLNKTSTTGL